MFLHQSKYQRSLSCMCLKRKNLTSRYVRVINGHFKEKPD